MAQSQFVVIIKLWSFLRVKKRYRTLEHYIVDKKEARKTINDFSSQSLQKHSSRVNAQADTVAWNHHCVSVIRGCMYFKGLPVYFWWAW